ncbi:MAG: beta-carboxysome assembly chaperone CcmS [Waterburya sp.]
MFDFGDHRPEIAEQKWRSQLDLFVTDYEQQLAALAWGLKQEWGESDDILGIDLQPTPHFVACSQDSLEKLNQNTKGIVQEILGIVDHYDPEIEVVIVGIGQGQIKLINFQPKKSPVECLAATGQDLDGLISTLETALSEYVSKSDQ